MWTRIHSQTVSGIERKDVWDIWTNIQDWPTWHDDLEYCRLESTFKVGHHFFLKPKNMGPVKIMITQIQDGFSFTDCTTFWGAKMYDTHAMEETPDGLKITNTLIVTGPLAWVWIWLVAKNVADSVPQETAALIELARQRRA